MKICYAKVTIFFGPLTHFKREKFLTRLYYIKDKKEKIEKKK